MKKISTVLCFVSQSNVCVCFFLNNFLLWSGFELVVETLVSIKFFLTEAIVCDCCNICFKGRFSSISFFMCQNSSNSVEDFLRLLSEPQFMAKNKNKKAIKHKHSSHYLKPSSTRYDVDSKRLDSIKTECQSDKGRGNKS